MIKGISILCILLKIVWLPGVNLINPLTPVKNDCKKWPLQNEVALAMT